MSKSDKRKIVPWAEFRGKKRRSLPGLLAYGEQIADRFKRAVETPGADIERERRNAWNEFNNRLTYSNLDVRSDDYRAAHNAFERQLDAAIEELSEGNGDSEA